MDSVVWIVNKIMIRLRVSSGVDSKYYDRSRTIKYGVQGVTFCSYFRLSPKVKAIMFKKSLKKGTNET